LEIIARFHWSKWWSPSEFFAVGIVAALGLLGPLAGSVAANRHAETAARVVDAIQAQLQGQSLESVARCLMTSEQLADKDAMTTYNPADDDLLFFASLSGDKVGRCDAALWQNDDREKFFEIALVRNEPLSPVGNDATAAWLAYTIRVRWPLFIASAHGVVQPGVTPSALVPVDHSHKQVLFFTAAVRR